MSDTSPTGHAIYAVVRASLRLVSSSSELLTAPELVALEEDIYATLAVIRGQIQSEETGPFTQIVFKCLATHSSFTGDGRARVDMTAWSDSDEEKEVEKEVGMVGTSTAGAGGTHPILSTSWQLTHGDHRWCRWKRASYVGRFPGVSGQVLILPPISPNPHSLSI